MPTLVAFSGRSGDCIVVDGEPSDINRELAQSKRSPTGTCQLTQIPGKGQMNFEPKNVFVNPDRVAYVGEPSL